jgi:serine protease Do
MSGGPTVDEAGNVLGVNSFLLRNQQNFNFITDTTDLGAFIRQQGVNPLAPGATPGVETSSGPIGGGPVSESTEDSGGFPWWVLGVVALFLAAAGGGFVWYQRNRTRPVPAEQPPSPVFAGTGIPNYGPAPQQPPPNLPPTCAHQNNPPGARFCATCGTPLP